MWLSKVSEPVRSQVLSPRRQLKHWCRTCESSPTRELVPLASPRPFPLPPDQSEVHCASAFASSATRNHSTLRLVRPAPPNRYMIASFPFKANFLEYFATHNGVDTLRMGKKASASNQG